MYRIGNYIYNYCPTGDIIRCGEIHIGIDGEYIIWYS